MRILRVSLAVSLAFAAFAAAAADVSLVTIADGNARVLRGSVWYKLVAGAPFQEGDVIDAGERTTVQVELATGGTLNLVGPGALYAATVSPPGGKDASEFGLDRGWLKFVSTAPGARLRTSVVVATVNDAIVVAHQEAKLFELFVETGSAKLAEAGRTGRDGPAHEAKAGEYWTRDGDKPFSSERRAPVKFVASMPRPLIDKLASLAPKFKGKKVSLTVDREITLAEADPWLAGPYRRAFARRLGGRLADPTFRKAVEANIAAYPDFDRVLHPEKYPAGATTPAQAAAPGAPAAAAAPPVAPPPAPAAKSATPPAPAAPANPPPKAGTKSGALWWSPALSLLYPDAPEMVL
jgi:hypothetical protein